MRHELLILQALFQLTKAHRPMNEAALAYHAELPRTEVAVALRALASEDLIWNLPGGPRLTMLGLAVATLSLRARQPAPVTAKARTVRQRVPLLRAA